MKISVFCDIAPCSPLKVSKRFGGTSSVHLDGRKQTRTLVCYLLHIGLLLGLFFDPENRGDMFFRNFSWLSTDYTALYPRRQNAS
jgi:hypothetical protein